MAGISKVFAYQERMPDMTISTVAARLLASPFAGTLQSLVFELLPAMVTDVPTADEAGVMPYVTLIDERSDQLALEGEADLIFIDGDHTYEGCLADVRRLVPNNLRPGGYLVLHDYYGWYDAQKKSASPVRAVIEQLIAEGQLEHILIDTGYMSFVIFRKPDPKSAATLAAL